MMLLLLYYDDDDVVDKMVDVDDMCDEKYSDYWIDFILFHSCTFVCIIINIFSIYFLGQSAGFLKY